MPSDKVLLRNKALDTPTFVVVSGPQDADTLQQWVADVVESGIPIGVDTETTGLNPLVDHVRLIQVATKEKAVVVDLFGGWERTDNDSTVDWNSDGLRELKQLLKSNQTKILQNAAFDLNFLRSEGIVLGGCIFDTMVASKIINNGNGDKNDLGSIVRRTLKYELPKELQKANWGADVTPEMLLYAARDAICLPHLATELEEALKSKRTKPEFTLWDLFVLEMKVLRPIALMQWHGFGFDLEAALQLFDQLQTEAEALKIVFLEHLDEAIKQKNPDEPQKWLPRDPDGSVNTRERDSGSVRAGTKLYKGFNPRSPQQMATAFESAGLLLPPTEKGKPSLDKNLLSFIKGSYPLVNEYANWKIAVTKVSNLEKLIESVGSDGRIHASYRQMGTDTGRLSCASPNLQQVNRGAEFRSKFVADPGYVLVVADFSQIELRVAAELSGEPRMLEAYQAGRDLHTETASLITNVPLEEVTKAARTSAKIANFGLLYGAGPATLRKQAMTEYGIDMDMKEAKSIVEGFRAAYPQLYTWQQQEGSRTTPAVMTALGRRRMLVGFNDKYTTRINTQVQGTAGDIAKIAISLLWQHLCVAPVNQAKLIAMVHDEIVLEVREEHKEKWAAVLKRSMELAGESVCEKVPIVAEVSHGSTWADAK